MPYRRKRLLRSSVRRQLKICLLVIVVSIAAGGLIILIGQALDPHSSVGTDLLGKQKLKIIEKYKSEYGAQWQEKIKEDYLSK